MPIAPNKGLPYLFLISTQREKTDNKNDESAHKKGNPGITLIDNNQVTLIR